MKVGIEKINAYTPPMCVSMQMLAEARGADPAHPLEELLVRRRALNPLWEDPVTMAVNAATGLLEGESVEDIELVIVGSESSVDFGKPMSTYVQRYCGIGANCRNFETKHACYGGTSALMMAAHWVRSGVRPGKKALVVCADQSRMHLGKPWEYVLGAGATAMLISDQPEVLELELETNGYWTQEIFDTYRPTAHKEVGHADTSLYGYLDALEGAYEDFERKAGEVDYLGEFKKHVYHVPFGGMTFRAHRAMLRRIGRYTTRQARESWRERTLGSLVYNGEFGGTYTSATFVALMGLIDSSPELQGGDRITMYSYGSGSCAEFYAGKLGAQARERVASMQLAARLEARHAASLAEYEAIETQRTAWIDQPSYEVASAPEQSHPGGLWERHYEGSGRLVLDGLEDFERHYRRA